MYDIFPPSPRRSILKIKLLVVSMTSTEGAFLLASMKLRCLSAILCICLMLPILSLCTLNLISFCKHPSTSFYILFHMGMICSCWYLTLWDFYYFFVVIMYIIIVIHNSLFLCAVLTHGGIQKIKANGINSSLPWFNINDQ